eukprot:CAMPEP_0172371020 /NCGR_PEP_ID=MMETSP1060-20121228/40823_1 /TAXON_ID=37318 /ORGANISM="Pseudo-nitzschia pungens, Strain cf. cingulata" /LENGTH=487 /DNA_ID=CAMNT_0013096513 /DNA_START=196 /DNA_END=1659 /DNA_ORIENTATION=+
MIRQITAVVVSLLLYLGSTLVTIQSFSPRKSRTRKTTNNVLQVREKRSGRVASRSCGNRISSSRLFERSDFSSHPYSVYYGASGSTARQNFDQNDDINDVYGYGSDETEGGKEQYTNHDRTLKSMQDDSRVSGRRGATVFGRRFEDGNRGGHANSKDVFFLDDPHAVDDQSSSFNDDQSSGFNDDQSSGFNDDQSSGFNDDDYSSFNDHDYSSFNDNEYSRFNDDEYMEDPHMMNRLGGLLYERDNLRRSLDAVIRENMHLQNQQSLDNVPESYNAVECDEYWDNNSFFNDRNTSIRRDQTISEVVNEVMAELKSMQQTLLALQTEQQRQNQNKRRDFLHQAATTSTDSLTIESVISNVENMQKTLETLDTVENEDDVDATQTEASTVEAVQTEQINEDDLNASYLSQQHRLSQDETTNSQIGSIEPDDAARIISGEYVVVINAELKRKSEMEGAINQDRKEIILENNIAEEESPPFCGENFGSRYL